MPPKKIPQNRFINNGVIAQKQQKHILHKYMKKKHVGTDKLSSHLIRQYY